MNKQEFIEKLESRKDWKSSLSDSFNEGYKGGIGFALDLATKIDEPKKEVVPQDVADFIEDGNRYDKIAFLVHQKYLGVNSLMRECPVKDWLRSVDYKTVLSLVNGYEVEKEQLYRVLLDEAEGSQWRHVLIIDNGKIVPSKRKKNNANSVSSCELLTEFQIKNYKDGKFWNDKFTVKVEN